MIRSSAFKALRTKATVASIERISDFPANSRIFSLIQPTGNIHLGNYLGALKNWKKIANEAPASADCFFGTADLHSLTIMPNPKTLKENRDGAIASLLASGLDPHRCVIFHQSNVPEHAELNWILVCLTSMGALNRMTQWKSKANVNESQSIYSESVMGQTKAGLLLYPVLQAADVLLYNSTHVPVGDDQSQHLELCRGIASTFNHTYGNFFTMPQTLLTPTKKIGSLRSPEKKMSKSDADQNSAVYINDSADVIAKKFRKAVTDSIQGRVTFDPINRPGVSNLINIVSGITDKSIDETVESLSWIKNHKELKDYVTEVVVEEFKGKNAEYEKLMGDRQYLAHVAETGTTKAREVASKNIQEIKKLVGLA
ncbi:tryptophan-tRNA ligase [Candidozyma auris]|nr:tryptophan-tRNA ligase [[Candida] auris]QEL61216.1 tryptophan-tRNA ligase [[Candida] auris]